MKLSEQVKPISYLKAHASEIIRDIAIEHKAVVITQNGEAKAILQDLESFEKMQESLAMLKIIAQGKKDQEEGKINTASKAFRNLKKRIKES